MKHHDAPTQMHGQPVHQPMPQTPLVIVNPKAASGRTRLRIPRLTAWLANHSQGATLVETQSRGHAEQLAYEAKRKGHDHVIAVGGDGTFQELINGLLQCPSHERLSAGLVPAGRGNDLARGLHLPTDPMQAMATAMGSNRRKIDVAMAADAHGNTRYFAAAGGAGFDAQVAHTMATQQRFWMHGEIGYMLATLNELRRFRNCQLSITLRTDTGEQVMQGHFLFAAFANGPFYGGGMQICPDACLDDGLLDVCLVGNLSRLAALKELPGIYRATHVKHPKVTMARVRSMRIEAQPGVKVHLDGEPFGELPIELSVQPGAIELACTKS